MNNKYDNDEIQLVNDLSRIVEDFLQQKLISGYEQHMIASIVNASVIEFTGRVVCFLLSGHVGKQKQKDIAKKSKKHFSEILDNYINKGNH